MTQYLGSIKKKQSEQLFAFNSAKLPIKCAQMFIIAKKENNEFTMKV